jgi:putative redox protein
MSAPDDVAGISAAVGQTVTDERAWISARVGASGFRPDIVAGQHALVADEPVAVGGTNTGPTPYEYLLAALSSCMAMTLRIYADRKGWPLEGVTVMLRTERAHEKDCEDCETSEVGIPRVSRRVELTGPLTDDQRKRLLLVADRCPVKQTLARGIIVENAA